MKLSVVGIGIKGVSQLTIEALSVLKHSQRVLFHTGKEDLFRVFLNDNGICEYRCLSNLYIDGRRDVDNYQAMHDVIIKEVAEYQDVCFLIEGHPTFGVSLTQQLKNSCDASGIQFEVITGVSSFDTMLIDICRDPLERGTVLVDANRLILFRIPLPAGLDVMIYHLGSVGVSENDLSTPGLTSKIQVLQEYLMEFFPKNHDVFVIVSSELNSMSPSINRVKLFQICELSDSVSNSSSLFVPALLPVNLNVDFAKMLGVSSIVEEV